VHPLLLLFLIFGIPAVTAFAWVSVRGTDSSRRYILTRIALTLPMASCFFLVGTMMLTDAVS